MCKHTDGTLIHVLVAGSPDEASGACADGTAVQRVGVTHCTFIAWVTDAGIIQVAQQTCSQKLIEFKSEIMGKID